MKKLMIALLLSVSLAACSQTPAVNYENLDNKAFAEKMKEQDVVILDVRTPEEFRNGHMPHAVAIDYNNPSFKKEIENLDKSKTYLVYCAAGGRSAKAANLLSQQGFDKVYNLEKGISKWDGAVEK